MNVSSTITILVLWSLSLAGQVDTSYSFFVAGHTYGKPGVNNAGFHPPFKDKFQYIQNRPEIQFGVLTGDIVLNSTALDWNEIDSDINALGIPIYFAVGNHDIEDRPLYESRYGRTYYSHIRHNDLFIVLDPNLDGWNIAGAQLAFLKEVIANNSMTTKNIYVFFHQVLWTEETAHFDHIIPNSREGKISPVNFWSTIAPIFSSIPNDVFMFAGDLGASWATDLSYDRYNNITLIASGMGEEDGENFIVVNIASDKAVDYDVICLADNNPYCLGALTDHLEVDINVALKLDLDEDFIYPNPAYEHLTLPYKENSILELYDLSGVLIFKTAITEQPTQEISISHIPMGLYFARINSTEGASIQKLIIK